MKWSTLSLRDKIEYLYRMLNRAKTSGGTIQSITGNGVDNTDPNNPVVNAIPLSGTEVGSPVTGDIELTGDGLDLSLFYIDENNYRKSLYFLTNGFSFTNHEDYNNFPSVFTDIIISPDGKGITSNHYYGANYDDNTYVQKKYVDDNLATLTEEQIKGKKLTASVSGTYNIDLNAASDFHLTMTADTAFTFTNTPTGNEVRRCKIRLTGEFSPTWTQGGLTVFGDAYVGTKWNDILPEIWLDGTIKGLLIFQEREGI